MKKKEALDTFDPLQGNDTIYEFIEWLYRNDYVIFSSKEYDKSKEWYECAKTCGWDDKKEV